MKTSQNPLSLRSDCARSLASVERNTMSRCLILAALVVASCFATKLGAESLTSLDYHITGTFLQVTPAVVTVPKGIAGSVLVSVVAGGSTNNAAVAQLTSGAYVQAIIRGPSFPTPQRMVGAPNAPLMLPPLNLVGDYELDSITLVDSVTGQTRMEGTPSTVPVHVFDQVLISSVTSQPLTLDQIQQKGIAIDESNFRAVQFNVSFVLNGQTIPVSFPVVSPKFSDSTELIPADQVEAKLQQAAAINQQIAASVVQLPPQLQTAGLNIQVQGLNFQVADPGDPATLGLAIPPIPALMVIPGNIGFLHQFFSVKIFTENGAPAGSGLAVDNVQAHLDLPPGPDGILSTNYDQPGDDPLRFARIGPNKIIQPTQPVVDPGPDGQLGTADDISRLQPGETGQAEFLVEGLQEGLWVMNVDLTANLYGLAAGVVPIKGKAAGSVLVRNPSFSLTFSHPDVVRVGEPYTASITILNTGVTPANLVQVSLNKNSISGAILDVGQPETIQIGTILPGQSATATYRMVAQRTGQIAFSDLTTSDNSVLGRFRFTMGVDAQGVPLSPDTIAMPEFVNYLPSNLVFAANRVLGQALSIATAAQLPPGIVSMGNAIITRRVLDLAEAGQRVQYGDSLKRVLADLLRDWQGGRVADDGFDALLRTSDAGAEWRAVLFGDMEGTDGLTGTGRLLDRAPDLAGLGQQFVIASAGPGQLRTDFTGGTNNATTAGSSQPYALVYPGTNGNWAVTPYLTNAVFTWTFTNGPPSADMAVLLVNTNGQAQELRWQVPNPPVTAVYQFALADPTQSLQVDTNGDGTIDLTLNATPTAVNELPLTLVAVQQDLTVVAGRPSPACVGPSYGNYGTVVAVVFSKPITQDSAGATNFYAVEGDNGANSVQVQPSGRVALLNLRKGISAIIPRQITVSGVTDVRGNALVAVPTPIQSFYPDSTNRFTGGVAVTGRVLKGDGSPAVGVPVTLTMYDGAAEPGGCQSWVRRVSQVLTDSGGNFDLDFVMSGIPYSISASDTSSLPPGAIPLIMQSTITESPDSQEVQQLINASANPNNLLGLLSAGSLPQAVAIVEGLDRAVLHDVVGIGTGREGQTVPFVLRFRGRGTVTGQVVDVDGVTPIPNAAVNLFPDPSSSELGRGVFSDGSGQFVFPGIPLGVFSIQVATSDRRSATMLGVLDTPGQATNVVISLPTNIVLYATLRGQVFDSDNVTPVPNARIFLGQYAGNTVNSVVSIVDADTSGAWEATNVPIQKLDVVAVTFDGTRQGARLGITPVANQITYANVTLQAATTVFGQVQFDDGRPATNALVAGGAALVRSDANGNFQLQGVPVGSATISAGLERNPAAGIDFPRLGSTSTTIIAGQANYVVVKLRPAGRIFGKVFDAQGNPQPNIRVAIPQEGGFYWTDADTNGNYAFENLGLGAYTISAPANAVAPQLNTSQLGQQIASGNEDQILAAFKEAVTVFIGANDPLINGDQLNFRPSSWGFTKASINFDGANVNADIHFIPQGTISGTVLNPQGVPIGAAVRLTGFGPDIDGNPIMSIRGDTTSDPATGAFGFTNILLAGPWGLQAASPFYPVVIATNGFTTEIEPDAQGIVLQFPPIQDVNGSIAGHVFNPDGSLVGEGTEVHIDISPDYLIQTDTNGYFNTQTEFPALGRSYTVTATNLVNGLMGRASVGMTPGITNVVDVHLLSRNSAIQVTVLQASGQPAAGAPVELDQGTWPNDAPLFATTDTNGVASFDGLWEGSYSVMAQFTEQSTRLFARGGGTVGPNGTIFLTLRLGATGSIVGSFVKQDLVTPIFGAEVAIGNLGFATTDTNGNFEFDGVPIGTYQISSSDPVTGGNAQTSTTLTFNGQTQTVQLVEATLGTVSGLVLDPYDNGFVPGVSVQISFSDGVTPSRTVTSGPNGGFNFPGSPMGAFHLNASYALPGAVGLTVSGQANGTLSTVATNVSVNIQLQPLTSLAVHVVRDDGVTPALNTTVTIYGGQAQDTSTNGDVVFSNLQIPGNYLVTAISRTGGDVFDGAQTNVSLTTRGTNAPVTMVLPGVGAVTGNVLASDGVTPVIHAEVTIQFQGPLFPGQSVTALSDGGGKFAFADVPIGPFLITAASASLAASENGTITTADETNQVTLRLGASGSLLGVVVRADGVTPVAGVDVAIDYKSQSQNAGRAVFFTGLDGAFRFDNVPIGAIHVTSAAPDFGGIIDFATALTTNGEVLNLGAIPFDEDLPAVVQVNPTNTTVGVPITNVVDLLFNEALETNSIDPSGIFIRGTNGNVTSTVTLLPDTNGVLRRVRIQPVKPLQSQQVYTVIVLSGDLPGPTGGLLGSGPRDLVGRAMAAPFQSFFATADNTPPQLLSLFPSNNAVQIDPSSVPRLTFDKTLNPTGFVFQVFGPSGVVPGTAAVGINGQVLSFVPTANLLPNATYSLVVSNVFDLAGNRAAGEPFTSTFATIDTIGPTIAVLKIASNAPPTAGALVPIEGDLATNEIGASVRFTQDFTPIGTATNAPYIAFAKLPTSGSTTIRAIATDQYGNDGQFTQLVVTVQAAVPPTVQFTLVSPTNGPVPTGSSVVVDVTATTDTGISNFTAVAGGAATGPLLSTSGTHLRVTGFVPTNAVEGQPVQIFAQVTDNIGLSSGQQAFTVPTRDIAPPSLAILGPTNNAVFNSGALLNLAVLASDNGTNLAVNLAVFGSITATQSVSLPLTPNAPATNVFALALTNGSPQGGPFTAMLTATDPAGNVTTASRSFQLRGPPPTVQIVRVTPTTGPVPSDSTLVVDVRASSGNGIAQLTANVTGVVTNSVTTNAASLRLQIPVPATALAGQQIQIQAQATDILGQPSGQETLLLTIGDGTPPTLTVNGPAEGTLFLVGQELDLSTITSDNSSNATLSLVVSGSVSATQTLAQALTPNVPVTNFFAVPLTNASPLGGPFTATFTATDSATNTTVVAHSFQLKGPGPTLAFTRITPASGSVPSGSTFRVEVLATSGNGLAQLTATVSGAVTNSTTSTAGSTLFVQRQVPPTELAGQQIQITAEATDTLGQSSGPQTLTLTISDGTPPTVAILSPPENTRLPLDQPLKLAFLAADNSSNVTVDLVLSGSLVATQSLALNLVPNTPLTNFFLVPLTNALPNGGLLTATLSAMDAAGNITTIARNFTLPPSLTTTVTWERQALGQTFTCTNGSGTYSWPNNNNWSQSAQFGDPCHSGQLVETAPSNWSTTNAPVGTTNDVILGALGGAPANLDVSVALHSLTIQSNGGLNMQFGATLTANRFDFQGDSGISAGGGGGPAPTLVLPAGGSLIKSAGSGAFAIAAQFDNQGGSVEVDRGTLALTNSDFAQSGGALNFVLGGRVAGQFGQLVVGGHATLGGPLNVTLTNGFVPAVGDQFPLLTSAGLSGAFTAATLPFDGALRFTNSAVVLVFTGQSNLPPALQFTRVTPTNGPVPSGAPFEVDVTAADEDGIAQITANVSGAVTNAFATNGSFLRITGVVPPTALAGQEVQITAQATDNIGQATSQIILLTISDGTPPAVAILSPPPNTLLPLGPSLNLSALVSDNSTNVTLKLSAFGSLAFTQSVALALQPNVPATNVFTVPVGVASPGGQLTAALVATDGARNSTTVTRDFFLPPSQPVPISWQDWSGSGFPSSNAFQVTLGVGSFTLNTAVTLNTLIIQPDGTLNMSLNGPGSSITAEHFIFQGDGAITRSGCCGPTILNLDGGTMEKIGGTNTFSIDPAVVLNSLDGTLKVDSGTLALPGNNSSYTDGAFQVTSNAALNLVPANNTANFNGNFTGSGAGAVLLSAGTLNADTGGATFNLPGSLFQWIGGTLQGYNPLTNAGTITLPSTNGVRLAGTLNNTGLLNHSGDGTLNFSEVGPGSSLENLSSGIYSLTGDAGLAPSDCCSGVFFDNYGLLRKNGGAGNSVISVAFDNRGGAVDVETGTLTLANNGTSVGGAWSVAAGATLDPTGGANPSWGGLMTGTGAGQVLLSQGTLSAAPNLELSFADHLFQWAGGTLVGPVSNLDVVSISGTNASTLVAEFDNLGLVRQTGTGGLGVSERGSGSLLQNLPGGTYQFESDSGLFRVDCCGPTEFANSGLVRKNGGTNESRIDGVSFDNLGGTLEVDTGRLTLANNGTSSNGTFTVAAGALLDLTGGESPTWAGAVTGSGAGRVELNSGQIVASPSLTLGCAPGLFQWTGGSFNGTVINTNVLTISGGGDVRAIGSFLNSGLLRHTGTGGLALSAQGPGTRFQNLADGTYQLDGSGRIFPSDCCGPVNFDNFGAFIKLGGPSNAVVSVAFNNLGGLVDVESGTLTLANNGTSSGGVFIAAANAALDITGGQSPTWSGLMNGQGAGAVLLASGTLNASPSLALNFTNGLFQWTGGSLIGVTTNLGTMMFSGPGSRRLLGQFLNANLIRHTGAGALALSETGSGTLFRNLVGATYQFETDSSIGPSDCCGLATFENDGLLRKSGGTNNTTISVAFNNAGGAIQVDVGGLTLANNGSSSNGTFTVAAGAEVDLTGGQQPIWSGRLAGTGAGQLQLNSGQLNAANMTLDCASGLFHWTGGSIAGTATNVNELDVTGGRIVGSFFNAGVIRQTGGALSLSQSGPGSQFINLPGGEYRFDSDATVAPSDCCGATVFNNFGLLRKSGGTNTATIGVPFSNQNGSIEVDRGTLALTSGNFAQGNGVFTVQLGGTNASQFGQLSVSGNASIAGPLNVVLTGGFEPAVGSQFQILACSSRNGAFSSIAMPNGISVNYSNTGVFLVVTGAVSLAPPAFVRQPSNVTNILGGRAVFAAAVEGAASRGYQWQFDGTNLDDNARVTGSQNNVLLIAGLAAADVGDYQLLVTNSLGAVTSRVASLTLVPCTPAPSGLVGFWSGNATAADLVGGHDGTLQSGATYSLVQDPLGQAAFAFSLGGVAEYVDLGAWNAGSNWTWAAWVNPSATPAGSHTIVGGVNECHDWALTMQDGVWSLEIRQPGGCTQTIKSGTNAVPGAWCFVAGSSDGATARMYVNGQITASAAVDPGYLGTATGVRIGGEVCCGGDNFPGLIEQVLLFDRALIDPEIQALFAAGTGRLCVAPTDSLAQVAGTRVDAPPQILSSRLNDGQFSFAVPTVAGQSYLVERNNDLSTTNWTYYTNFIGDGSLMRLNVPITHVQRFFRLRSAPLR